VRNEEMRETIRQGGIEKRGSPVESMNEREIVFPD